VAGLLFNKVSSTATTYSFSQRAHVAPALNYIATLAIILATAVTIPRMAIEIGAVNQQFLASVWPSLLIIFAASLVPVAALWFWHRSDSGTGAPEIDNPVQLGAALIFGLLYGIITLGMAAGEYYYGDAGTYLVSAISGLANVDAITLSSSRLVGQGRLPVETARNVIVITYMSNLVMKAVLATLIGNRRLGRAVAASFAAAFIAGLLVMLLM